MKALIALIVVALGGALVWYLASGKETLSIGISSSRPLGDAAKLEEHLRSKGLQRFDLNKDELRILFGERFPDVDAVSASEHVDSVPGMKHRVVLVRGADGRLLGVACRFRSGAKQFSLTGTRCDHFAAIYWLQLAGGPPAFEKLMEGGADARDYWLAKGDRGGMACTWRKEGAGGPAVITQEIHDTVVFWVK